MASASSVASPPPLSPLRTFPRHHPPKGHMGGSWDHLEDLGNLEKSRQYQLSGSWDQLSSSYYGSSQPVNAPGHFECQNVYSQEPIYSSKSPGVQSPGFNEHQQSFSYSDLQSPGIANLHSMYEVQSPNYAAGPPGNQTYFTYDEAALNNAYNEQNSIYGTRSATRLPETQPLSPNSMAIQSPVYNYPQSPPPIQSSDYPYLQSPGYSNPSTPMVFSEPNTPKDPQSAFDFPPPPVKDQSSNGLGVDSLLTHTLVKCSGKKKHSKFWNSSLFASSNKVPVSSDLISPRDSVAEAKGLLNGPGENNCFLNSAVQVSIEYCY